MNGNEIERIKALEVGQKFIKDDVKEVKADVKIILTNHLPHIKEAINDNKIKLALIIAVVTFVSTILGGRVLNLLF